MVIHSFVNAKIIKNHRCCRFLPRGLCGCNLRPRPPKSAPCIYIWKMQHCRITQPSPYANFMFDEADTKLPINPTLRLQIELYNKPGSCRNDGRQRDRYCRCIQLSSWKSINKVVFGWIGPSKIVWDAGRVQFPYHKRELVHYMAGPHHGGQMTPIVLPADCVALLLNRKSFI